MSDTSNADLRELARSLFPSRESEQAEAPDPTRGNVAPREGAEVAPPQPDEMIPFIRDLFGKDPHG